MSDHCQFCLQACADGQFLSNGSRYHQRCYDYVVRRRDDYAKHVAGLSDSLREIEHSISGFSTLFGLMRRLANASEYAELLERRSELHSLRRAPQAELSRMQAALRAAWDFWPDYPPDWEDRRRSAIGGANGCPHCYQRTRFLHVHHRIPLSRGGSNSADNLDVLCERCHSDEHGGKAFRYEFDRRQSPLSRTLDLLQQAIAQGKDVRFSYEKHSGEKTVRSMTPKRVAPYEHKRKEGSTLCVEGYCHLRRADRVFALRRMSRMRIVN
jgi:5-methylcytosine-specific restriction endonuclease McrA